MPISFSQWCLRLLSLVVQLVHVAVGLVLIVGLGAMCWQAVTTSVAGPRPSVALFTLASVLGLGSAAVLMTFLTAIWIHLAILVEWLDDVAHRRKP